MQQITRIWKQIRGLAWTSLFWLWVIYVSLWLEYSNVREEAAPPITQFSNLEFTGMRFEQLYMDGAQLVMEAPQAHYDSKKTHMEIVKPFLSWKNSESGEVFSATGEIGLILVDVSESALPSEFKVLDLMNGARAWGEQVTVDGDRMLFHNDEKKFYIPGPFTFKTLSIPSAKDRNKVYDPLNQRVEPMDPEKLKEITS